MRLVSHPYNINYALTKIYTTYNRNDFNSKKHDWTLKNTRAIAQNLMDTLITILFKALFTSTEEGYIFPCEKPRKTFSF